MDRVIKKWKLLSLFVLFLSACTLSEQTRKGVPSSGLIITPPSYYSTRKAKALGERYKQHLEQLVQQLVENSVTGKLQFANNIASVGGIGFFTHSASSSPDERYLEVVLGVPKVFDDTVDLNSKVNQLFSLYGFELLSILASDADIDDDKDVAGYGLNLSWRRTSKISGTRRVVLERAVIYISKQETRLFLDQGDSEMLLEGSVIFAIGADGLPIQFAYGRPEAGREQAKVSRVELDPNILEQDLLPERPPGQPPAEDMAEKASPGKIRKETGHGEEEIADKASTEKTVPKPESTPKRRQEVAKRARGLRQEAVTAPSGPVEAAKRTAPREQKVEPKLVLKEKTPRQAEQPEPSEQKARDKAAMAKATPEQESKPKRPKEAAKRAPDLPKEAVKVPSAPVEVVKRTVQAEQKAEPKLVLKEKTPKQAEDSGQEAKDKASREKTAPKPESRPERQKEAAKRAPDFPKEAVKAPSAPVEVVKRTAPPEQKVEPKVVLKGKTPKQADQEIKERAGSEKTFPKSESIVGDPKEAVKRIPDAREEAVKEPSAPVEMAKRTAQPREKTQRKLELKEEIPGAVEEKLTEPQPLQGYLVQFLFSERAEAERWSELLIREGYSTSVSTIRRNQHVRLRVGAFPTPTEASRFLEKLQKQGLVGMVLYHVPRHHSSPAMKRAGKKAHTVLPEKTAVDKAKASEEKRVKQPKTDREDGDAIVSRAVQKDVPDIKPPEPKAGMTLPEKKEEAKEKTEPEIVLKKRVPAAVEEKQPAVELPKVQATHGYLVQISFSNREEAQRWSELLTQEGYSTSTSMIMGNQLVRLRIGAFPSSAEAQGLLKKLRKQGLTGFIVQAPK